MAAMASGQATPLPWATDSSQYAYSVLTAWPIGNYQDRTAKQNLLFHQDRVDQTMPDNMDRVMECRKPEGRVVLLS